MPSVFDQKGIHGILEQLSEFIERAGSRRLPSRNGAELKMIINSLEKFEAKLSEDHEHSVKTGVSDALYAGRELAKFVKGANSDIVSKESANVFRRFLGYQITELLDREQNMERW